MKACVVGKGQSWNIQFPIKGGFIDKSGEVFGNGFAADLCLAVALRVVAGRGGVTYVEGGKELHRHFVRKLLAFICYKLERQPILADPTIEESSRNSQCLFVWQYNKFDVFRGGISDA